MTFSTARDLNIICIDPSLRSTGVFICEKGNAGRIQSRKKTSGKRCSECTSNTLRKKPKKKYDLCVIEGYSMGSRGSAATVLPEIGGISVPCFIANGTGY